MHVLLKDNRAGLQLSHIIVFESGVRLHSRNENDGACKLLFVPASAENVKLSALVHKVCSSVDQLVYQQLSFPKSSERMREKTPTLHTNWMSQLLKHVKHSIS